MDEHNDKAEIEIALAKAKEEAEQYLQNWKRAKADYVNLERQGERQREDWAFFASASCIQMFLPVYESLVQATTVPEPEDGLVRIRDQMRAALKSLRVEIMESLGKEPDPLLHEVIGKEVREGVESGVIIQEVQPGFMLGNKVLRPAKVIVAE